MRAKYLPLSMISKFEDAVLRLLYPSIDAAEEGRLPDHFSQEDVSKSVAFVPSIGNCMFRAESQDVATWDNLREEDTGEPPATLLVDEEDGEDDVCTSPGNPTFTRAQRKRLKRKMQILKGKRFIGPRLPFREEDGADAVHSKMDTDDAPCTPPSGNQGNPVVMSKTKKRRLAKKQRVGLPARQPQSAAFVANRICDGVVIKRIG